MTTYYYYLKENGDYCGSGAYMNNLTTGCTDINPNFDDTTHKAVWSFEYNEWLIVKLEWEPED